MIIAINSRNKQDQESNDPYFVMFGDKYRNLIHALDQRFMLGFFNRFIKDKNHCRKDCYTTKHSNDNTFCHNNTKITTKCKCHNTKSYKSCYCGDRTSYNGFECIRNRMSHRTVLISRETALVLFVAIQQENGVIHRNPQLQYRRQRFCNVTDLAKENVTSQIIYNRCTYTNQEKNRYQEGFSGNFQHQKRKNCRNYNINRDFFHCYILDIGYNTCHTCNKTLFAGNLTHLTDCIHCFVR